MTRLAIATALAIIGASGAAAFTSQQSEDIASVNGANAAAVVCEDYAFDSVAAFALLLKAGLNPNGPMIISKMNKAFPAAVAYLELMNPAVSCPFVWGLYGPGDKRFSGLLKRK